VLDVPFGEEAERVAGVGFIPDLRRPGLFCAGTCTSGGMSPWATLHHNRQILNTASSEKSRSAHAGWCASASSPH